LRGGLKSVTPLQNNTRNFGDDWGSKVTKPVSLAMLFPLADASFGYSIVKGAKTGPYFSRGGLPRGRRLTHYFLDGELFYLA
jgi:hypothetical protein